MIQEHLEWLRCWGVVFYTLLMQPVLCLKPTRHRKPSNSADIAGANRAYHVEGGRGRQEKIEGVKFWDELNRLTMQPPRVQLVS